MVERRIAKPPLTADALLQGEYVTVQFNSGHMLRVEWCEGEQCIRVRSLLGRIHIQPSAANEILVS
jgi:hypothetical protein